MFNKNLFTSLATSITIVALVLGASIVHVQLAYAASLTTLSDSMSSVRAGYVSDHTIQFVTPTGISAGQQIQISFPVGWNLGNLATTSVDLATSTSASCSGFTDALISNTASGLTWGVATTSSSLTLISGTAVVPANRCIQIEIGSNATSSGTGSSTYMNPVTSTSSIITIGGTMADSGTVTVVIIDDDTVSMTGTVNQSLTFTISTTTVYFGNVTSVSAKFASSTNPAGDTTETIAHTLGVSTNAPSGFAISVRGQTMTSLQNPANTISAIGGTAASSTPTTEQFGIRATQAGGTNVSVSQPFAFATSYGYNATATTSATFATGTGSTPESTLSLRYVTNIAAITEAGTYAANIVYVATANF